MTSISFGTMPPWMIDKIQREKQEEKERNRIQPSIPVPDYDEIPDKEPPRKDDDGGPIVIDMMA